LISENDGIGLLNTYNEIVERIWRSSWSAVWIASDNFTDNTM